MAESDTETGELDIRVMHGKRPNVYFAFECKCLNVIRKGHRRSQSGKYVGTGGMGCFLSGQYAGGSDCGGMIGYVMDNDVDYAKLAVNQALKKYKKSLGLQEPAQLAPASMLKDEFLCSKTKHSIKGNTVKIYHIFLAYNVEPAKYRPFRN